ncbi:MAG: aspartate aminotransferase family protein [Armatimonadota bacterium]
MTETAPTRETTKRLSPEIVARFKAQVIAEYVGRHPKSRELHARGKVALPGGDTRTVTYFDPFPLYIGRGEGCRLYDVDGHRLLDLLGNYTSMIWGHAHPKIVEAARAQIARGTGFAAPTEGQAILGEMIRERLPSVQKIRFTNSGTEAAMHAIRLARAYTGREKIVKMEGGYHGSYDAVEVSVHPDPDGAGPASSPRALPESKGIPPSVVDDVLVAPFNNLGAVEAILRAHRDAIAAVIVEPIQGVAGTILPRDGFLGFLREITQELGILLIFDEVISFRLGYHGAQGIYGVSPDLTVLGKIIGGGFPVGAFGGRDGIMALYDPARPGAMVQSGTFNANPVTLAAGIAGLELLTAAEIERINRLGDRLRRGLQALFDASPVPARASGLGSLLTLLFTGAEVVNYRDTTTADQPLSAAFHLALLQEGIFSAPRGMMALSLPMSEADIDDALGAVSTVLNRLTIEV